LHFAAFNDEIEIVTIASCPTPPFSGSRPSADSLDWPASSCNDKQQTCFLTRIELVRFLRACLIFSSVFLAGCRAEDPIERYEVEHIDREWLVLRVAVFEHADTVWFFRLSGPEALVKEQMPAFEALVESVRFDDTKKPPITFADPKEWTKDPKLKMRFASYLIETKPKPIEVKISPMERENFEWLPNIHRWQKELNLPLAEPNEIKDLKKPGKVGDHDLTWVDMKGLGIYQIGARELEAPPKKKAPRQFGQGGDTPFKYEVPQGWVKKQPPNDGVTAALLVVEGKGEIASVTFTSLLGDGGGLAKNIKRWREVSLGLPPVPDREAVNSAVEWKVAGLKAHFVDLSNPKGPPKNNRILAVIVRVGQSTWFVRMAGSSDWVGQNKNAFETFVKSLQLDAPEE
jgi:hypothetical protein